MVTALDVLAQINIPDGRTAVATSDRMIEFFGQEGRDICNG
jgi:hypothetical protein